MTFSLDLSELSVVFISYDEPDADRNFALLQAAAPHAIRVHGVKGFDAAHRQAGKVATSAHVITVDGDNRLTEPDFFARRLRLTPRDLTSVVSFAARLPHNGLVYGNGGIKIWPRVMLRTLRTHEASHDAGPGVDFAWRIPYVQAFGAPSDSVVTATPFQAFRAGLREGVRLTVQNGVTAATQFPDLPPGAALRAHVAESVIERLAIWCSVGSDAPNGAYAILGARMGCVMAMLDRFDIQRIADFDWIEAFWNGTVAPATATAAGLQAELARFAARTTSELDLRVDYLSPDASAFVKSIYRAPQRLGTLLPQ
ncbi:MAG: hypothetical protein WBN04_19615 [Paracoccaceae bacterium]